VINPFVEQRLRLDTGDRLANVIATLPTTLRETNAGPLLGIVRELEASSIVELGVINAVANVDVENREAIHEQRLILSDYRDRRLHDRDRTHCSNIGRILTQVRSEPTGPTAGTRVQVVDEVLEPIVRADERLLDDVEAILEKAVTAIVAMDDATRVVEAETAQSRFVEEMEPTKQAIKANLSRLNKLTGELIDTM